MQLAADVHQCTWHIVKVDLVQKLNIQTAIRRGGPVDDRYSHLCSTVSGSEVCTIQSRAVFVNNPAPRCQEKFGVGDASQRLVYTRWHAPGGLGSRTFSNTPKPKTKKSQRKACVAIATLTLTYFCARGAPKKPRRSHVVQWHGAIDGMFNTGRERKPGCDQSQRKN